MNKILFAHNYYKALIKYLYLLMTMEWYNIYSSMDFPFSSCRETAGDTVEVDGPYEGERRISLTTVKSYRPRQTSTV